MNTNTQRASLFQMDGIPENVPGPPHGPSARGGHDCGLRHSRHYHFRRCRAAAADRVILIQASLVVSALATAAPALSHRESERPPLRGRTSRDSGRELCLCAQHAGHRGSFRHLCHPGGPDCGRRLCRAGRSYYQEDTKIFPPLIAGTVVFTIASPCIPRPSTIWPEGPDSRLRLLAELGCRHLYPGSCDCAEPFRQGIFEAGLHPHRETAGYSFSIPSEW